MLYHTVKCNSVGFLTLSPSLSIKKQKKKHYHRHQHHNTHILSKTEIEAFSSLVNFHTHTPKILHMDTLFHVSFFPLLQFNLTSKPSTVRLFHTLIWQTSFSCFLAAPNENASSESNKSNNKNIKIAQRSLSVICCRCPLRSLYLNSKIDWIG